MISMVYETKTRIRFIFKKSYILVKVKKTIMEILYLYVEDENRGYGLGTLLLIFAITRIKDWNPNIKKVLLDDCSDNVCSLRKNIYRNIGFRFLKKAKYDKNKKQFIIQGPERVLMLNRYSLFFRYYLKNYVLRNLLYIS